MTLDIISAPILADVTHGFFGRAGGASSGVFRGLNCGFGSSDQSDLVAINRARVAAAMDVAPGDLVGVTQVHSARAVTIRSPGEAGAEADALVTDRPGLALAILTADCAPILFADPEAGVIGAAHAGWKGAKGGVIEATLDAMERLGARRPAIGAAIGPTISQCAYEVGPDFRDAFLADEATSARFFVAGEDGRWQFDLPGYALQRLDRAGIGRRGWTRHCTYADPERFFSYRRATHRNEADYGRLIAAIRL
ncbi:peptidoglycan editing factor PgeF [Wenxinia saemankumensis]|uniref:Purine nucleoside phosphorylase n=1 Tax=Wenxinia saemankumensis TaxID=1447782 RepID=A0A1M6BX07_9RHOB|nr:peptidoglycan editing factor PgeF [Wenxinia saemankumensis]SHI53276.1 conserved hypothetical protein [Wenxinia saemankumensis]